MKYQRNEASEIEEYKIFSLKLDQNLVTKSSAKIKFKWLNIEFNHIMEIIDDIESDVVIGRDLLLNNEDANRFKNLMSSCSKTPIST
jgi:hypothetical protein